MIKIPTLYVRDMSSQPALVTPVLTPGCEWVRDGEGDATVKWDGTACLMRAGQLFKRRELRPGDATPAEFESLGTDENTGKTVGWVPVGAGPEDRWHREALMNETASLPDGTYELCGPKIQGNKNGFMTHRLLSHADAPHLPVPRDYAGIREYLTVRDDLEGVVWHHPDGRMAKIKRRDFGLQW